MLTPGLEAVREHLRSHAAVPVYRTYQNDTLTPVSAYLRLSSGAEHKGVLLESVERGEQLARYSFVGVQPRRELWMTEEGLVSDGEALDGDEDPFAALDDLCGDWNAPSYENLPGFTGGLVGYLGYELIRHIEPTVDVPGPDDTYPFPDLHLYLMDRLLIFDHVKRAVHLVGHVRRGFGDAAEQYARVESELDEWVERLREPATPPDVLRPERPLQDRVSSNVGPEPFQEAVRTIKRHIRDGDVFQAVLSRRFDVQDPNHPFNLYRRLRSLNPSPYMFYLDYGERQLIGSSPEILVQKEGPTARVRPIAGTRRRGDTPAEDRELAEELLGDDKELAEHTMLVDLGRNDLGRVCRPGSVEVTDRAYIERYSHVMHMVSNVEGEIPADVSAVDLLRATFPAGTVTGAPKVRAMQILTRLEPDRRGPYAGAVGYLGFGGDMDTCITIRTLLADGDRYSVQAGAGIVADSRPAREDEETREKARALLRTLETLPETRFL